MEQEIFVNEPPVLQSDGSYTITKTLDGEDVAPGEYNLELFYLGDSLGNIAHVKDYYPEIWDSMDKTFIIEPELAPNESPTSLNIDEMSVYENLVGEELGLISVYDPDGDDLIFELSGFNSDHFELIPYV